MAHRAMGEHVCQELPVGMAVEYGARNHCKRVRQAREQEVRQTEHQDVDRDEYGGDVPVGIAEAPVDDRVSHICEKSSHMKVCVKTQFLHTVQFLHTSAGTFL